MYRKLVLLPPTLEEVLDKSSFCCVESIDIIQHFSVNHVNTLNTVDPGLTLKLDFFFVCFVSKVVPQVPNNPNLWYISGKMTHIYNHA